MNFLKKIQEYIFLNYGTIVPIRAIVMFVIILVLLVILIVSILANSNYFRSKKLPVPSVPINVLLQQHGINATN